MKKNSRRHGAVTLNEVGDSEGLAALNMPSAKFLTFLWYNLLASEIIFITEVRNMEIKHVFECRKCKKPVKAVLKSKGKSIPDACPHCGVKLDFSDVEKKLSGIDASLAIIGGAFNASSKR